MTTIADRIKNSTISQKLIAQATFVAADTATGSFMPDDARDHWRIDRTSQWCAIHCKGLWRRTLRMAAGVLVFEFERAEDAAALKRVTGRVPTLIHCR